MGLGGRMTIDEWRAEALRRGGGSFGSVRFACPVCGSAATPDDFVAAGADGRRAPEECIGRAMPQAPKGAGGSGPCDYAAFGFIKALGCVTVTHPDGTETYAFPFAD